jgi:hypothetical protein
MTKKTNSINVINVNNSLRMGFYVPGYGIVIRVKHK